MPKPPPRPADRPAVPVPARDASGLHPIDHQAAADAAIQGQTEIPVAPTSDAEQTTTPRRRDATTPRKTSPKQRRTKAPAVADAVAFTLRLDPDDALAVDAWMLELRQELGRNRLDKSEVIRALLDLARQRPEIHRALIRSLS